MATRKRAAQAKRKMLPGRPTKYDPLYDDRAYKLCLLGATDVEIAAVFGTTQQTLCAWKKAHPSFLEALTRGKIDADAEVARSLYQRALGYSHPAVRIMQYDGVPIEVPYTEHYPPDTQAASMWLRNRQPAKWRDKPVADGDVDAPQPVKIEVSVRDARVRDDDRPESEPAAG
jgi:hypothetical protein